MTEFCYAVRTMGRALVEDGLGVVIVVACVVAVRLTVNKLLK